MSATGPKPDAKKLLRVQELMAKHLHYPARVKAVMKAFGLKQRAADYLIAKARAELDRDLDISRPERRREMRDYLEGVVEEYRRKRDGRTVVAGVRELIRLDGLQEPETTITEHRGAVDLGVSVELPEKDRARLEELRQREAEKKGGGA